MKKTILTSILTVSFFVPLIAGAELAITTDTGATVTVATGTTTLAHVFTACSQASIEARDTSIASARTAYNTEMAQALDVRKEAEKNAVAIVDVDAKKEAIEAAVEAYRKSVTSAQNTLTENRKIAWAGFEKDMEGCREFKKDDRAALVVEKKAAVVKKIEEKKEIVADKKAEVQTFKAEARALVEVKQAEVKTFRETLKEQLSALRAFFTKKSVTVEANTSATVSQ